MTADTMTAGSTVRSIGRDIQPRSCSLSPGASFGKTQTEQYGGRPVAEQLVRRHQAGVARREHRHGGCFGARGSHSTKGDHQICCTQPTAPDAQVDRSGDCERPAIEGSRQWGGVAHAQSLPHCAMPSPKLSRSATDPAYNCQLVLPARSQTAPTDSYGWLARTVSALLARGPSGLSAPARCAWPNLSRGWRMLDATLLRSRGPASGPSPVRGR